MARLAGQVAVVPGGGNGDGHARSVAGGL